MMKIYLNQITRLVFIAISIMVLGCNDTPKKSTEKLAETSHRKQDTLWVQKLIEGYKSFNREKTVASADLIFEAIELMPKKNWENYFVCAMVYVPKGKTDKAFSAINKALESGLRDVELLKTFPEFNALHSDVRWKTLITKAENRQQAYLKIIESPELLQLLKELWAADQAALAVYEKNEASLDSTATNADYDRFFEPVEERWEINKKKLDSIVRIHGWPGYKLVGEYGAKVAWAIPQHYPDVFYKETCLSLIKKSVEEKDTDPNFYAELKDRIARETWQKQTYGASMGETAPYPIKDPSRINTRRLELGLMEPIEVYAIYHGIEYSVPTKEEAISQANSSYDEAQTNYKKFEQFFKERKIDSALFYIRKSIKYYGELTNEQLYEASLKLNIHNDFRCIRLSFRIVKVLIWRRWDNRFDGIKRDIFPSYSEGDWELLNGLLETSRK